MNAPQPRLNNAAAENIGFALQDITAAINWIESNAATNGFAAGLARQLGDGLTYNQWAAAIRAALGAASPSPRRRRTATPNLAQVPAAAPAAAPAAVRNARVKLSPADRSLARKAIAKAPGWTDYAARRGINTATLSGPSLLDAADAVGVDLAAVLDTHRSAARDKGQDVFGKIGTGNIVAPPAAGTGAVDWQRVRAIAKEEAQALIVPVVRDVVVMVKPDGTRASLGAAPTHPQFANLARTAACRDFAGQHLNVFLVGPTGTGKSFACRQLAQLLGLPFYFQSQASEGFDLVGYERVNGVLKVTPFVEAFRNGGVCLLDECDRYDPKASVALNAALANGEIALDSGEVVKRHKDFICVASGNTFGFGGSSDFTAAEKMDLSTISRFQVRLAWGVDPATENAIAAARADNANVAAGWLVEVRAVRAAMERLGLPYLADQRCVEAGANLIASGMPLDVVRDVTYLASLDADQRKAVLDLTASARLRQGAVANATDAA